jgi:shikimate dehydrogenase
VETAQPAGEQASAQVATAVAPREFGGRKDGTEPTRFGDWEKHGRCIDF